jgi:hypothetical protein
MDDALSPETMAENLETMGRHQRTMPYLPRERAVVPRQWPVSAGAGLSPVTTARLRGRRAVSRANGGKSGDMDRYQRTMAHLSG